MLTTEYPVTSSNLKAGMGIFGTADAWTSSLVNFGARNPLGALAWFPAASANGGFIGGMTSNAPLLSTNSGYGSGILAKYCLYRSTANPAMQAGPAPVYYTDETFTVVSGQYSEAYLASNSSFCAGWLPLNTGTGTYGVGTAISATILNNSATGYTSAVATTGGSFVWIILAGFIPSAYLAAGAQGNMVYGSGNFATTGIAPGSNFTNKAIGYVVGAVTSNIGDVVAVPGWLL
jgi:hypothetical protein